jgi:hypothetical protein
MFITQANTRLLQICNFYFLVALIYWKYEWSCKQSFLLWIGSYLQDDESVVWLLVAQSGQRGEPFSSSQRIGDPSGCQVPAIRWSQLASAASHGRTRGWGFKICSWCLFYQRRKYIDAMKRSGGEKLELARGVCWGREGKIAIAFSVIVFYEKQVILVFVKTHFPGFVEIWFFLSMFLLPHPNRILVC